MEFTRNNIQFYDLTLDRASIYEESTDAIVPDSYPDIVRIACAVGSAMIKDESPQNDRVLVSGTVKASVLYQPEGEDGLRELIVPLSFAHIEEGKGLTADSTCFVRCRVVNVDARAVNSRKISVTARLCFEVSAYDSRELMLTEHVDGGTMPLEILHETHHVCLPQNVCSREFTILEDLEMPGTEGQRVLDTQCTLRLTDSRAMHGKAIVKGDAQLRSLLLQTDGGLKTMEQTVPFTQILDMEGAEEGQPLRVRFAIKNLDCELHEMGVLSIGIGATALLYTEQTQALRTIRDLYQTTCPLNVQAQQVRVSNTMPFGQLHAEVNETMPLGMRVGQILDASAVCHGAQQESAETMRLTMHVQLLFLGDDGAPYSTGRTLTVMAPLPSEAKNVSARDVSLRVLATPSGEDSASLRIIVSGDLLQRETCMVNDVTSVEVGAPQDNGRGAVTLVMRYVGAEEPLWDIAKNYGTTARAIRAANGLAEDAATVGGAMLLIPICEK